MKRWLLVLLVVPLGLVLWLFLSAPPRQSVKLPDGSVLTLRDVTYGKQHRHVFGGVAQKLYALIPARLTGGAANIGVLTETNAALAFWLTRDALPPQPDSLFYMLEDASGSVAGSHWYVYKSGIPYPHEGIGLGFRNWPRRDSHLRLAIYQMALRDESLTRLATFTVANPAPRKHPVWKAAQLPVSTRVDDYDFALHKLLFGVDSDGVYQPFTNAVASRALAVFRATKNGRPSRSWAPASIAISDATGNTAEVGSWGMTSRDGQYRMTFHSVLWPAEPWKLRVELSRADNYSSDELVHLPPIALPKEFLAAKTTNTFAVNVSTNWHEVPLTVMALEGKSRNFSGPGIRLRCGTLPPDHRLTLVKMEDDQKRNLSGGGSGSDNNEYTYSLKLHTNSAVLHLTIAIHKSVFAEFVALPTLVTTNAAAR
jgi:hypothetical protein